MKQIAFFTTICAVCATLCCGCGNSPAWHRTEGSVWATSYHITYRADRQLDDSILHVMDQVEMSLSPFREESLVSRINRGETDETDTLLRKIFTTSQQINLESGGMFDPTVAPAVNLWRFGYRDSGHEPTDSEIEQARGVVGIDGCSLENLRIVKKSTATEFDFSAITKGYGCDRIGEMLRRNGCSDYMVEIGGEIALSGKNPQGEPWHIMIDAPVANDTTVVHNAMSVVKLTDCGIATSGNYRNYRDTPSGRVGHTINPMTCRPVQTTTLSATVIAPDAMTADALATACMAMTHADALRMITSRPDTEAMLIEAADSGRWTVTCTENFPR